MNEEDRKEFIKDFTKADGATKLEMWTYALEQEVIWEDVIAKMSQIAKEQKIDKKLDKAMQEDMKNITE